MNMDIDISWILNFYLYSDTKLDLDGMDIIQPSFIPTHVASKFRKSYILKS